MDDDEPLLPRPNKTPDKCGGLHITPERWVYEHIPGEPPAYKRAFCPKCRKFMARAFGSIDKGGKLSKEKK